MHNKSKNPIINTEGYPRGHMDSTPLPNAGRAAARGISRRWSEWPGRRDRTDRHERRDAIDSKAVKTPLPCGCESSVIFGTG